MKFEFKAKPVAEVTYPALMRSICGRPAVVLFTDRNVGMELTADGFSPSEDLWINADARDEWEPFVGDIKVSA